MVSGETKNDDDLSQIMCRRQAGCKSDEGNIESKQAYYNYLKRIIPDATNTVPFRDGRHRSMNDKPNILSDGGSGGGISSQGRGVKWRPAVPVGHYTFQVVYPTLWYCMAATNNLELGLELNYR